MYVKSALWDILALSRTFIFVSVTKVPKTLVGDEQHMLWLNLYLLVSEMDAPMFLLKEKKIGPGKTEMR